MIMQRGRRTAIPHRCCSARIFKG